jgi:hypothetical protein
MTTFPAGAPLTLGRSRHARREVAMHPFVGSPTAATIRVPWLIVFLGIGLIMLAAFNIVLVLIDVF